MSKRPAERPATDTEADGYVQPGSVAHRATSRVYGAPWERATERQLQRMVEEALRWSGYCTYHTYLSVRSAKGYPDITAAKPGRPILFIELKAERGRLTPAQEHWGAVLSAVPGVVYRVVRPRDWDALMALLQED